MKLHRMLFNDRLATTLEQAKQNKTQLAVMFLDLDRFKNINDTLTRWDTRQEIYCCKT